MSRTTDRRRFLGGLALGGMVAAPAEQTHAAPFGAGGKEVRLEHLRPRQIDEAMKACPALFQPLGTIEWHGLHNVVGLDAVKAHLLCTRAAQRGGGLVAPALFGGVGGLDEPHTFVMEPENDIFSVLVRGWVERLCREAVRQGFKAVIVLTGHYGAAQQMVIREAAVRMSRALAVPVLGTPEYMLALDVGYLGDHAAWGETSLMMYLYPESVDLAQLGSAPHKGVGGRDPKKYATRGDGERLAETIIGRLAGLAQQMPTWDAATLRRFIDAEAALAGRQIALFGAEKVAWAGWRNLGKGVMRDYGRFLVERRFEDIIAQVGKL